MKPERMTIKCPECNCEGVILLRIGQISRIEYPENEYIYHGVCPLCECWVEGNEKELSEYQISI